VATYCYTALNETIERDYPMATVPWTFTKDGVVWTRDLAAEKVGYKEQKRSNARWPMEPCVGSGVNPEDAQRLRDHFEKCGVPTEVHPSGDPVYRTPKHRERALKCRNLHDKSSFN